METTQYSFWKSVLWLLGSLVFAAVALPVVFFIIGVMSVMGIHGVSEWQSWLILVLWAPLLAIPAWQLFVHKHELVAWIYIVIVGFVAIPYLSAATIIR